MTEETLLEKLADLEHRQWQSWTAYFLSNLTKENEVRWSEQALKNYAQLSEEDKEKDRVYARKVLEILNKPEFTAEELRYIEVIMDINASIGGDKITKTIETFMFSKSVGDEDKTKLLANVVMELAKANLITEQIRTKIEKWRKEL